MPEIVEPCPFCGAQPTIEKDHDSWSAVCENTACPVDAVWTHYEKSKQKVIDAWNTRYQPNIIDTDKYYKDE